MGKNNREVIFVADDCLTERQIAVIKELEIIMNREDKIVDEEMEKQERSLTEKQMLEKIGKFFEEKSLKDNVNVKEVRNLMVDRVFSGDDALDAKVLYMMNYNSIPNWNSMYPINCVKATNFVIDNYSDKVTHANFTKRLFKVKNVVEIDDMYLHFKGDVLVYFNKNALEVSIFYGRKSDLEFVNQLTEDFRKFKYRNSYAKPEIHLLTSGARGLEVTPLEITKPKLSIADNYNDDFQEIHNTIIKRLKKKNDKGIVLLHGKPGTGKTSYIRYLISSLRKNIIFLPPNLAGAMTDPSLIKVLIENPGSIFVIEDAETIIMDRGQNGNNSAVSTLLNLADGLLSDCLSIQILCTMNCDISKIDEALLRKGRLIAKYEFNELCTEKGQKLSDKLGFNTKIEKPTILAQLYNQNDPTFNPNTGQKRIGFAMN